jgi:serine/threonine-protein kinase
MNAPAQTEVPPTQGLVGGKYKLVRLIGKGGMGSVWEGQHYELGTRVAIKFIETEHAVSEEARSRFKREAMAAATVKSKHAIQIHDHGITQEGIPYIVMEMLIGESLERRVERLSRMSLQETAKVLLQVSRALAKAHEQGIIHRDLKPDNVFIVRDADDGEEIAKVLDFGIAKVQGAPGNPGMTSSTKTGAVLGTPFYMSPEQARGLRNVDHRTDVWSLGVIAFRCVTGRLPFDGESVGDLLVKICTAPVPVPSQVVPGIPPGFDGWFMRTMEREPERRFGSVMEQANELCFVAGIAGPGQGAPMSNQQTVGVHAALITPHGMMASAAARSSGPHVPSGQAVSGYGQAPMTQQSPSHGSNPSHPSFQQQPGLITNSPFTSEQVAGIPSGGKGKVIGILAGVLVVFIGLGGAGYAYSKHQAQQHDDGLAAGSNATPPPPASTVVPDPKVVDSVKTDVKPIESAAPSTGAAPTNETPAPHVEPHPKPGTKPAPAPKPAPLPVAKPAPAPAPAPAAPAPAPAPKPKNNDPGY